MHSQYFIMVSCWIFQNFLTQYFPAACEKANDAASYWCCPLTLAMCVHFRQKRCHFIFHTQRDCTWVRFVLRGSVVFTSSNMVSCWAWVSCRPTRLLCNTPEHYARNFTSPDSPDGTFEMPALYSTPDNTFSLHCEHNVLNLPHI